MGARRARFSCHGPEPETPRNVPLPRRELPAASRIGLMRLESILILGGIIALGCYVNEHRRRGSREGGGTAYDSSVARPGDQSYGRVRPAGSSATRDDRGRWDSLDEALDESFPASDPTATY